MSLIDIHWAALIEFNKYKFSFFDAVKKEGYREKEILELKNHGINDDSIFLSHLLGIYKASTEAGLTK